MSDAPVKAVPTETAVAPVLPVPSAPAKKRPEGLTQEGKFAPGNKLATSRKGIKNRITSALLEGFEARVNKDGPSVNELCFLRDVWQDERVSLPIRLNAAAIILKHNLPTDVKVTVDDEGPRDIKIAVQIVQQKIAQFYGAPALPVANAIDAEIVEGSGDAAR